MSYISRKTSLSILTGVFAMAIANLENVSRGSEISGLSEERTHCGGNEARCEVLEVLSLGVTYDKYRQGQLWDAIKLGTAFSPLRKYDEAKVPWSASDKAGQSGGRAIDALENATTAVPMYWGMPSMYAGLPLAARDQGTMQSPFLGLPASAETNGMAWHLFVAGSWLLAESPDGLLETAFQFFDQHPDVPLLFVSTAETPDDHDRRAPPGTHRLVRDGRYFVEFPDSAVVLVLGRRDRVERLRKFAWDDVGNDFGQNKIRKAYFALRERLSDGEGHYMRDLSVDEWLSETSRLAVRDDIRTGWGAHRQRTDWKASPWFPVPWSKAQLEAFDRLPTLGFVHRPVYLKWTDTKDLRPVNEVRKRAMKEGIDMAIRSRGGLEKGDFPSRVIVANGGQTDRSLVLHGALFAMKAEGGPEYNINDGLRFFDADRRLGNIGATTFFMETAIGILGSYREGGASLAINMRNAEGASIVLITPASSELRAKQKHPAGGDVFRHNVEPAYDPDVYK